MDQLHKHILPHFETALGELGLLTQEIAQTLLNDLSELMQIFRTQDRNQTNELIATFPQLESSVHRLQNTCTQVLGQFHPLGVDLRYVMAITRTADKLMEATHELYSMTKQVKKEIKTHQSLFPDLLIPLMTMAIDEIKDAINALAEKDAEMAQSVRINDKVLDKAHRKALSQIIAQASEGKTHLNVNLLFMIRSIERLGDIAKTIAAAVIFYDEATDIRHTPINTHQA